MPKTNDWDTCLYVMVAETGYAKVGITKNLKQRLNAIQNGNPHEVSVYWSRCYHGQSRIIEQTTLKHFAESRLRGEWLDVPPDEIVAYIEECAKGVHADDMAVFYTLHDKEHSYLEFD